MSQFIDLAAELNGQPQFIYPYNIGLQYMVTCLSPQIELLRLGQDVVYSTYEGSILAFYLNSLYRQSTHYSTDLLHFIQIAVGLYWYQKTATDIIILLEVWVITEMERAKIRMMEKQYEKEIRDALIDFV
jgi:hypothetical protein